jgi:hypothetical protein
MKHIIIIGAQRCGSTLIYDLLDQHPQVLMSKPPRPEPKYFLKKRDYSNRQKVYFDYIQKFYSNPAHKIRYFGEKSTSYIESAIAANRICQILPGVKFLCILRDPVLRAISNYNFSVANGLEKESFETAISRTASEITSLARYQTSSVNPFNYIQRGFYAMYLRQYLKIVDRDQIKIVLLENLLRNPALIDDIFRWLGLEANCVKYSIVKKVNSSCIQTHPDFHLLEAIGSIYIGSIRELGDEFNVDVSLWESSPWYLNR